MNQDLQLSKDPNSHRATMRCGKWCTRLFCLLALPVAFIVLLGTVHAQTMQSPDITKVPTLYVVPYAHLDTQWRWEFPQSISE